MREKDRVRVKNKRKPKERKVKLITNFLSRKNTFFSQLIVRKKCVDKHFPTYAHMYAFCVATWLLSNHCNVCLGY